MFKFWHLQLVGGHVRIISDKQKQVLVNEVQTSYRNNSDGPIHKLVHLPEDEHAPELKLLTDGFVSVTPIPENVESQINLKGAPTAAEPEPEPAVQISESQTRLEEVKPDADSTSTAQPG